MRKHLPSKELFIGKTFRSIPGYKITDYVDSGSRGVLYRAYNQELDNECAFKIVPVENLPEERYLDEAKKANLLDHSSVVRYHDVFPYSEDGLKYVIFRCDYVKGTNLRKYMKDSALRANIDVTFIQTFLVTMLGLLYELNHRGYHHGDLHAGNVLVAKSDYDITGRTVFRVTDFGVREVSGITAHVNDMLYVAATFRSLLECIDYRDCSPRDRYYYNVFRDEFAARHLIETDPIADRFTGGPEGLMAKLGGLEERYREEASQDSTERTLVSPFDYPNCEQIGRSHLLLKNLYSDRLLGLYEVEARSNIMLTRPAGCGKTTVFRALSLEYLMATGGDRPENLDYVGLYYRCDDLYFAFPRYRGRGEPEKIDVPMHFLVSTLLSIVLRDVGKWAEKYFLDELRSGEEGLVEALWSILELDPPASPSANRIPTIVGRLNGIERRRAVRGNRGAQGAGRHKARYFGPENLLDACVCVRERLPFLDNRPFYFFVDDYSHPKITMELQENLNRLLMHRGGDVFFKLATESPVSFARQDIDGKKYVESREYELLNLGLRYITGDATQVSLFLQDLFRRRFRAVSDYPVRSLEELIGSFARNENEVARAFRDTRSRSTSVASEYAGCEVITSMCSGDIHYMIRLVGKMIEDHGGMTRLRSINTTPKIPARSQSQTIRAAAGAFMESIRTLPDKGPQLALVVTALGNVARSYLMYETSRNETSQPPHQASRIEPYEPLRLSPEARDILHELLRYSVVIEDPRGKSRRGSIVPRFYLRGYLIPHFRLTFSRRDSLRLESRELEDLLRRPEKFEESMRLKSKEDAARRRGKRAEYVDQQMLFEE